MKEWTLINRYGDRIEKISQGRDSTMKVRFSYWTFLNGRRISGHLNKVKKAINDFREEKCDWKELWE